MHRPRKRWRATICASALIAGCSGLSVSGPPVAGAFVGSHGLQDSPGQILAGTLDLVGSCLGLRTVTGDPVVVVWPTGTTLSGSGEMVVPSLGTRHQLGDRLEIDGARYTGQPRLREILGSSGTAARCPDSEYFFMTGFGTTGEEPAE